MVKDNETKLVELFLMDGQSVGEYEIKITGKGKGVLYTNGKHYGIDLSEIDETVGTIYEEIQIAGADLMNLTTTN